MRIRSLLLFALAAVPMGLRGAESPDDLAARKLAAGSEIATVLRDTISPDGNLAVLFAARKKGLKQAVWPLVIPDLSPTSTDAVGDDNYVIENCVVSLRDQRRVATVTSAADSWAPYWGASRADFSVLWGPTQEGSYYGLLNYNFGWGSADILLVDVDGTTMRQTSIRDLLENAARQFSAKRGNKLTTHQIGYQLLGINKPQGTPALRDPLTVRINFTAQIPKGDDDAIEGTMTVKLARSGKGPPTAIVLGIKAGHEDPDPRPQPTTTALRAPVAATTPSIADFATFRKAVNARIDAKEFKTAIKDLPNAEPGHRRYVKGWLEGTVLQRLMHVDSISDKNESVTFYFWRGGQLTSVYQVRNGPATFLKGVDECTETYNFVDEKLVSWKHTPGTGDCLIDPTTPGFAEASNRVLEESIKYAQPIYRAVGAD